MTTFDEPNEANDPAPPYVPKLPSLFPDHGSPGNSEVPPKSRWTWREICGAGLPFVVILLIIIALLYALAGCANETVALSRQPNADMASRPTIVSTPAQPFPRPAPIELEPPPRARIGPAPEAERAGDGPPVSPPLLDPTPAPPLPPPPGVAPTSVKRTVLSGPAFGDYPGEREEVQP